MNDHVSARLEGPETILPVSSVAPDSIESARAAWNTSENRSCDTFLPKLEIWQEPGLAADGRPVPPGISILPGLPMDNQFHFEPVREQAGPVATFVLVMNTSPSEVGLQRGEEAARALLRMGQTEGLFPMPKNTPYFNNRDGRYVYTEKGGWIDMVHFLFYAGKAYGYKQAGVSNPIGEAVQEGYAQEFFDPDHSKYSYEDLPSDKFGADFAVNHFDPNSRLNLGQQIEMYFNEQLKATQPGRAPNYDRIPEAASKNRPTALNRNTVPFFTQ